MSETDYGREQALWAAEAADKRGALDTAILDMRELMVVCDYFLICHGRSSTHMRAIADAAEERLAQEQIKAKFRAGARDATWVVLDFGLIVIHVFSEEGREYYGLERLWADAPRVPFEPSAGIVTPAAAGGADE